MGHNKIVITGYLGRDPELAYTQGGKSVTKFSVAVDRVQTNRESGEKTKATQWFNVVAWEKLGETCNEYLRKGSHVLIEGRMQSRDFERQDKTTGTAWEIVASEMEMLDSKGSSQGGAAGGDEAGAMNEEEVPF